jgi:phage terminase large subunit
MPRHTPLARQSMSAEAIQAWRADPRRFVRDVFGVTPDAWQDDVLAAFPHHQRIAMLASRGPGKTTVLAWLAWNFLLTRPEPKIAATSISADNLSDNFWSECAKWQSRSPLLQSTFTWTKTRIESKEKPQTWWMAARAWSKSADQQTAANTLAGLHADHILFLLDESSGIPDAVMATAEAALSSCVEGHIVQAGNPTHRTGPLYRAATTERRLWRVFEVNGDPDNPKRSPRVSIEWARQQIEKYGRENPFVLISVFGRFPPSSLNTLIGPDEVRAATLQQYREQDIANHPRILGVDVARFGDDSSIVFPRQGLVAFDPLQYRNIDGTQGAGLVARKWQDWDADACFVDDTGGYGASWIDNLIRLGRTPIGVGFAGKPDDPRYANKRAEMAFECVAWVKDGGRIPDIPELRAAMTETTYTFQGDRLLVEPKELIKARLGYSPDHFDALMITFAAPVTRMHAGMPGMRHRGHEFEYDPFASFWNVERTPQRHRGHVFEYDPFAEPWNAG